MGTSDDDEQAGDGKEPPEDGEDPERTERIREAFRRALLRHPVRCVIYELLKHRPGLNKNQVGDTLELYPNRLKFHMDRMIQAGLIETRSSPRGQEVVCFLAEDADLWEDEATRILFGRSPLRQVAMYLAEHPGATTGEIAEALDVTPVTVRHHLDNLLEHDLVDRFQIERHYEYHAGPKLDRWVDEVGDGFERWWETDED